MKAVFGFCAEGGGCVHHKALNLPDYAIDADSTHMYDSICGTTYTWLALG